MTHPLLPNTIACCRAALRVARASLNEPSRHFSVETQRQHQAEIEAALADLRRCEVVDVSPRPVIVCLCGSTRFWREFQRASLAETLAGKIVLSIGAATGTDDEHFGNLPREEYDRVKAMLDELHLRKIDLADEVLILNRGGYIGESTARELAYARASGKRVRFLEPESIAEPQTWQES